jgi:preprotein translocase subunit YajC
VEPLIFIGAMVVLMWLLVIRPQRRRANEHGEMISQLSVDDEIVTAGGVYGRITAMDGDVLTVQIAPDVSVRVARGAITGRIDAEGEQTQTGHTTASDDS